MSNDTIEEIFTYNESLDHVTNSEEDDLIEWTFKVITSYEGSLPRTYPNYNGSTYNSSTYNSSTYNLTIEWENEDVTN